MKIPASILALTLIVVVGLACNLAERLGGEDNSVMVSDLWPDVPPFPGATKDDAKLPLPVRLMFRAVMPGKMAFITFRTDKSEDEIKNFYKGDHMNTAGWARMDASCFQDTEQMRTGGKLCLFTKGGQNQKPEMLGVMINEQSGSRSIFYMRIDTSQLEQK